jgi:aspartate 1-decarboxylase
MMIKKLTAKIRNATITAASTEYEGSITIDKDIMDYLGLLDYQAVDVNVKTGRDHFRGTTYVIPGPRGTGCIEANGALANHISKGDIVHINAYGYEEWGPARFQRGPWIIEDNLTWRKDAS